MYRVGSNGKGLELDSYVWVRKDILKEIQNGNSNLDDIQLQRKTKNWKPGATAATLSGRKRGADSWQWVRAKLCATATVPSVHENAQTTTASTNSSNPYTQVRLRRVAGNGASPLKSSPTLRQQQQYVTIFVDDPEAGADIQNQNFSFQTSSLDEQDQQPLIHMANIWWRCGTTGYRTPPQDLTSLNHLHEPAVVYCLRKRYEADLIYTYTGRVLLALNPFRQIPSLYGQQTIETYRDYETSSSDTAIQDRPPHVYATAQDAYSAMLRESQNQSILVSGESGAGKTVTTKIILGYLTTLSKWKLRESVEEEGHGIETQVIHSNPILESFGNARTLRNDNSSRFGKFIDVRFQSNGRLKSASIQTYLLEKVRLIAPGKGERNYHVFYELLAGLSQRERNAFGLGNRRGPEDFSMTAVSGMFDRRDGIDDRNTYRELRTALTTIGLGDVDQLQLFSVCCALLHCSNLSFIESSSEASAIDSTNPSLRSALKLLGVSAEALGQSLCCTAIEARGEVLYKTLSRAQAAKALEALIKATYSAMFQTIVNRINLSIAKSDDGTQTMQDLSIGVLDIFGFESFDSNSFEQLCINFCNEALQQQFNQYVFKQEQAEYQREGIEWSFISFPDNQDILDLIDKKHGGILSILDEQNLIPQCTDQSFARAMYEKCSVHPRFSVNSSQKIAGKFCLEHYAGIVEYGTETFLEKNKDELPKETTELLKSSSIKYIAGLGAILADSRSPNSTIESVRVLRRSNSSLVKESVGSQFSGQLRDLRAKIEFTAPHYIRCLKPNDLLVPGRFSPAIIADQLRCAGVLEAIRVSRVGFPQRYLHKEFTRRYQMLARAQIQKYRRFYSEMDLCEVVVQAVAALIQHPTTIRASERTGSQKLQSDLGGDEKMGIQMGLTKVFLRRYAFERLEQLRNQLMRRAALVIQAGGRMLVARNRFIVAYYSILVIQRLARRVLAIRIVAAARRHRAATRIQSNWRRYIAERYFFASLLIAMWSQRSYRGMVAREICACMLLELKVLRIQRAWRRYRTRTHRRIKYDAIMKLQLMIRGYQARAKLRELRRAARDVRVIMKQRDMFRDEALRLRKEAMSPREAPSVSSCGDSYEIQQLRNEIAALKSILFGAEATKRSEAEVNGMGLDRNIFPPETGSPLLRDLARSDIFFSTNTIANTSIVSDSSLLNRSLLDDIEEDDNDDEGMVAHRESSLQVVSPSSNNRITEFQFNTTHQEVTSGHVTPKSVLGHVIVESRGIAMVGSPFRQQVSLFHQAISNGDDALACLMLDQSEFGPLLVNESYADGSSPLHFAVARGNFQLVQTLLDYGAASNCQDFNGNTPLHVSTHVDIIGLLLHIGKANPNIPNNEGFCALHVATSRLDVASVQLLLRRNVDVNVADNYHWFTPLHLLTSGRGIGISAVDDDGQRLKIANLLCTAPLQTAVDINCQDRNGNSPLHNVAVLEIEEACDLLRILLENGADPNLMNTRSQTPLHLLCHNETLRKIGVMQEMLYNMLYNGAKPNIPSQTGCTALHLALYHHDIDSAVQLMHRGAELHLIWNKPKRWVSFWEDMGSTEVLALDMVSDENSLHRLLAAISTPQKWAPNRPWCMQCKTMLGSFARSLHCRHCGRLVCGACAPQSLNPSYFPKSFEIYEKSWVCIVCEQILISRKDGEDETLETASVVDDGTTASRSSF